MEAASDPPPDRHGFDAMGDRVHAAAAVRKRYVLEKTNYALLPKGGLTRDTRRCVAPNRNGTPYVYRVR
jgi:hypothetical protein